MPLASSLRLNGLQLLLISVVRCLPVEQQTRVSSYTDGNHQTETVPADGFVPQSSSNVPLMVAETVQNHPDEPPGLSTTDTERFRRMAYGYQPPPYAYNYPPPPYHRGHQPPQYGYSPAPMPYSPPYRRPPMGNPYLHQAPYGAAYNKHRPSMPYQASSYTLPPMQKQVPYSHSPYPTPEYTKPASYPTPKEAAPYIPKAIADYTESMPYAKMQPEYKPAPTPYVKEAVLEGYDTPQYKDEYELKAKPLVDFVNFKSFTKFKLNPSDVEKYPYHKEPSGRYYRNTGDSLAGTNASEVVDLEFLKEMDIEDNEIDGSLSVVKEVLKDLALYITVKEGNKNGKKDSKVTLSIEVPDKFLPENRTELLKSSVYS